MPRRAYKEIQLPQVRSFCETVRLGSLMAAAQQLGLSQPTVCEQVHALERALELKLITRHRHGCRPTEAGRLVAELAGPLVTGINSLKHAVHEALGRAETWLTIAATQRVLTDDLPPVIVQFERSHPHVHLRLLEMPHERICAAVEAGEADLGLTLDRGEQAARQGLLFEAAYRLEYFLVVPQDHPLARRRTIRPGDLAEYPLVNSPTGIGSPTLAAELERLGLFRTQPRRVEAIYSAVVRRYVQLGFGIGLVVGLPHHVEESADLHQRSMSRYFGRDTLYLVRRKTAVARESVRAFIRVLGQTLGSAAPKHAPRRSRG